VAPASFDKTLDGPPLFPGQREPIRRTMAGEAWNKMTLHPVLAAGGLSRRGERSPLADSEELVRNTCYTWLANVRGGLPPRSREVLVLRELEGSSYKEIAAITGVAIGTVMSSLSRARDRLREALCAKGRKEGP